MAQKRLSARSFNVTQQMWDVLVQAHSGGGAAASSSAVPDSFQQSKYEQAFSALSQMSEHRRLRQVASRMKLPEILWAVLVIGCIVVIGSACLFGCENFPLHFIHVFVLSLLLSQANAFASRNKLSRNCLNDQRDAWIHFPGICETARRVRLPLKFPFATLQFGESQKYQKINTKGHSIFKIRFYLVRCP